MKKIVLGSVVALFAVFAFGQGASADTINIDTSQSPETESLIVDDNYIDLDNLIVTEDDQNYRIIDNKMVPIENESILNSLNNGPSLFGTENWGVLISNGGYHEKTISTSKGQSVTYGNQPRSGGTATRNFTIATGLHVYLNSTSNSSRRSFTFNSIGGSTRCRTTNYSTGQWFDMWITY